jgi:hypothetical protein
MSLRSARFADLAEQIGAAAQRSAAAPPRSRAEG